MTSETVDITIKLVDEDEPDALYRLYDGQENPQPCRIVLDLDYGEVWAEFNDHTDNFLPLAMITGVWRSYDIPVLTARAANELMRTLEPLFARVLAGSEVDFVDGDRVGELNGDARTAEDRIGEVIAIHSVPANIVQGVQAEEWWAERDLPEALTADTTREELAALVEDQEREAAEDSEVGYTVLHGAHEYLTARREEMREPIREELEEIAEHYADLRAQRDAMIRRIAAWGDSSRALGDRARISHTQAWKIAEAKPDESDK